MAILQLAFAGYAAAFVRRWGIIALTLMWVGFAIPYHGPGNAFMGELFVLAGYAIGLRSRPIVLQAIQHLPRRNCKRT